MEPTDKELREIFEAAHREWIYRAAKNTLNGDSLLLAKCYYIAVLAFITRKENEQGKE